MPYSIVFKYRDLQAWENTTNTHQAHVVVPQRYLQNIPCAKIKITAI